MRIKVGDLVKTGSSAPTSILTDSTFDKVQSTETIPLSLIYTSKRQVRFKINENVVQSILDTWPVKTNPTVRTRNPDIDYDVPEEFKYVVTAGHHRLEAMKRYGLKEAEFTLIPRHEVDTSQKIIYQQLTENLVKHDMHILEQAFSFMECLGYDFLTKEKVETPANEGLYAKDIAKAFGVSKSKGTVFRKIFMNLDQTDIDTIMQNGITIEGAVHYIAWLKDIGINNWFEILEPYARDKDGKFNPKKLSGDLVKNIYESMLATQQAEAEKQRQLEDAANQQHFEVEPLVDNQVEQPVEVSLEETTQHSTAKNVSTETVKSAKPDTIKAVEQTQAVKPSAPDVPMPLKISKRDRKVVPKTIIYENSQGKTTILDPRTLAVVFQELLSGHSVEDLIQNLSPKLADHITEADGQEIFDTVNSVMDA